MPTEPDDVQPHNDTQAEDREAMEEAAFREQCARWLGLFAIALFVMGPIMLLAVWLSAKMGGHLPAWENWGTPGPDNGPWNPNQNLWHLNYGFDKALAFPFYAFLCAGLSYFAKSNRLALAVLGASLLFDIAIVAVFMPLFD